MKAAYDGQTDIVRILMDMGANVKEKDDVSFLRCISFADIPHEMMLFLFAAAERNDGDTTCERQWFHGHCAIVAVNSALVSMV